MMSITFVFALLYYVLSLNGVILRLGSPTGDPADETFLNLLYFSGVTLLSIGYGDYVPVGSLRFFTLIEAGIGILLPAAYFIKAMNKKDTDDKDDEK